MESLGALAEEWLGHEKARGLRPATLETWARGIRAFFRKAERLGVADPACITLEILERYFAAQARRSAYGRGKKPLSPATLHAERTILRSFLGYLAGRKILLRNEALRLELGKVPPSPRRVPSREDVKRLLAAPDGGLYGIRDRAVLEVLYSSGLRCRELCALGLTDCDRAAGILRVREGKGGKERLVPIGEKAAEAVGRYLVRSRPRLLPVCEALFVGQWGERLRAYMIGGIARRWCRRAGIEPPVTPHQLRHACATHLLENGAPLPHLRVLLGHARIATTALYTHVDGRRLGEVLRRLDHRRRLEEPPSTS